MPKGSSPLSKTQNLTSQNSNEQNQNLDESNLAAQSKAKLPTVLELDPSTKSSEINHTEQDYQDRNISESSFNVQKKKLNISGTINQQDPKSPNASALNLSSQINNIEQDDPNFNKVSSYLHKRRASTGNQQGSKSPNGSNSSRRPSLETSGQSIVSPNNNSPRSNKRKSKAPSREPSPSPRSYKKSEKMHEYLNKMQTLMLGGQITTLRKIVNKYPEIINITFPNSADLMIHSLLRNFEIFQNVDDSLLTEESLNSFAKSLVPICKIIDENGKEHNYLTKIIGDDNDSIYDLAVKTKSNSLLDDLLDAPKGHHDKVYARAEPNKNEDDVIGIIQRKVRRGGIARSIVETAVSGPIGVVGGFLFALRTIPVPKKDDMEEPWAIHWTTLYIVSYYFSLIICAMAGGGLTLNYGERILAFLHPTKKFIPEDQEFFSESDFTEYESRTPTDENCQNSPLLNNPNNNVNPITDQDKSSSNPNTEVRSTHSFKNLVDKTLVVHRFAKNFVQRSVPPTHTKLQESSSNPNTGTRSSDALENFTDRILASSTENLLKKEMIVIDIESTSQSNSEDENLNIIVEQTANNNQTQGMSL